MPPRRPVVLLVEDEVLVRLFGADILEAAGFDVIEAANADEALRTLEARDDVQVLFTDIHMPGSLDGLELARCVHERWPDIELLIASGRSQVDPDEIPDNGRFVTKPYEPRRIVQQIWELTERHH
jgi:two-component system, response regulator PdtaR